MKKLLIMFTCLLSSLSVAYMYHNSSITSFLNAQSAPAFTLPKGAKIVLGKYNNKEVVWDIGNNNNNGSYVLMSSKPITDTGTTYDSSMPITSTPQSGANRENYCLRYSGGSVNNIQYCPVTPLKTEIAKIQTNQNENSIITKNPFLPSVSDVRNGGTLGLSLTDRAYKSAISYWLEGYITSPTGNGGNLGSIYHNTVQRFLDWDISILNYDFIDMSTGNSISRNEKIPWLSPLSNGVVVEYPIRPFTLIDKNKVVLAANISYTDGNWHNYAIDAGNLNANNELNPNKLRIQSSLTAVLQDIKNVSKTKSIQKVIKNSLVNLSVNANTGTNTRISVLLYNETGSNIQYYKMLEATKSGTNDYGSTPSDPKGHRCYRRWRK